MDTPESRECFNPAWSVQPLPRSGLDRDLLRAIDQIDRDGFGTSVGWDLDALSTLMDNSPLLGLLYSLTGKLVGYAIYQVPPYSLHNRRFLWINAICISKAWQGKGLSRACWGKASEIAGTAGIGWWGARTQHPGVLQQLSADAVSVYPFDSYYTEDIANFLISNIWELRSLSNLAAFPTIGILRNFYPEGRLGDYEVPLRALYEDWLARHHFDRLSGDALVCVAARYAACK